MGSRQGVVGAMSIQQQVIEFHQVFEHPILLRPTVPSDDRVRFRARLVLEEVFELLEALFDNESDVGGAHACTELREAREQLEQVIKRAAVKVDLVEAADAMADIDYVVEGTRLEFGINGEPIAAQVHRSNMEKASCDACGGFAIGPNNHPCEICKGTGRHLRKRADGKTLKPRHWQPPDIKGCLEAQEHDCHTMDLGYVLDHCDECGSTPKRPGDHHLITCSHCAAHDMDAPP
jgi:predicted HAD superfamily Cof-like phosphohydrolase